jgi:hypothetical protein
MNIRGELNQYSMIPITLNKYLKNDGAMVH